MPMTATTKAKSAPKAKAPVESTQSKHKKPVHDKKTLTKSVPIEKRKNVEGEPAGNTKKAKVTIIEPTKEEKKVVKQPKEKPTKPKVLAPTPESDSEDMKEGPPKKAQKSSPAAKKAQTKSTPKTSKQPPKFISSQAKPLPTKPTKTKRKPKSPSPTPAGSEGEAEEGGEVSDEEQVEHLHGFSTDEDDSSDEDEGTGDSEKPGLSAFEIAKLPTVAKDDASVKQRLEKAKRQPTEDRGVVYIGRLPHGFYEDQLRGYFSQFGNMTRLRVSRNKKTGKCKHYGFIEFDSSSVAQIVAETMDNYLLSGHILKCKLIPKDEVHPELWIGANRKWRVVPRDRIVRIQQNKPRTQEEQVKANERLIKRQNERKRKLEALGIEYDFDAASYKKAKADAEA